MYSSAAGLTVLATLGTAGFSAAAGGCFAVGFVFSSILATALTLDSGRAAFSFAGAAVAAGSARVATLATAVDLYKRSIKPVLSSSFIKVISTNCSGRAARAAGSLMPISRNMI